MNKTPSIFAIALVAIATAATTAATTANAQQAARKAYIVQLADSPAATYTGQVQGYSATKPPAGAKLQISAANVQAYMGYLGARQAAVLAALGNVPVTYRYSVAFNGFAARLTTAEVTQLKGNAGVVAVMADLPRTLDTSRTPAFLGLSTPGGLWGAPTNIKGEGIIIGVVDGGITPESPSFSDKVGTNGKPVPSNQAGTVVYSALPAGRYGGVCQAGPGFPASSCNNKLVGASFYRAAFDAAGNVIQPVEFDSPRDGDGHGSHTASTAGGNGDVAAVVNGQSVGMISGMAPRARVAAYKVCWLYVGSELATCYGADSIAAIDRAVADGVDVINFSISGTRTNYLDGVEVAFFNASAAGVFVAASAGNSGPANAVAHMSPWITTVAASTHDRLGVANLTLGNSASYSGASLQPTGLASKPLILSTEAGLAGADPTAVRLCFADTDNAGVAVLDPAKVAGRIVVCDRGTNARVDKSKAVKAAGGVGVILVNATATQAVADDAHYVPTVHVSLATGAPIKAYAAGGAGSASFSASAQATGVIAPVMGDFSSRGPSLASTGILKPDITAPGLAVLAAFTPEIVDAATTAADIAAGNYPAPAFNYLQGTSMSSPHIAGIAALLKQLNPSWSPAAIKSALMTTTTGVKLASGAPDTDRFGYGAGHANPTAAAFPGLVYDADFPDYYAFLCGQGLLNPAGGACSTFGFLSAPNLNLASLTSDVVGRQTLQRTVRNVGAGAATYTASIAVPGFTGAVTPSTLTLLPGATGTFRVAMQRTTAPLGEWAFGDLVWTDGVKQVRSPVTLRPLSLAAPRIVEETRATGTKTFSVGTGYSGSLKATPRGLVAATRTPGTVAIGASNCTKTIDVPAGTEWLRIALFDSETTGQGTDDLDLEVYLGTTLVAGSGGATAEELVNMLSPAAGTYKVCVVGFASTAASTNYTLSNWVVSPQSAAVGTFRAAAPTQVATAGVGSVVFAWSVPAGQRYFGLANFTDQGAAPVGRTALYVDAVSPVVAESTPTSKAMRKAQVAAKR